MWESIGYDEINWTYTATGRTLLNTFGDLSPRPFLIRPHYVFCSGSGFGIPHWGNGNVYHEDADGNPYYDFTIADQTYDAIVEAGHHVLMEIAFTPRDLLPPEADELTVVPSPTVYSNYEAGAWAYPPKDYEKWRGLVAAHVQHCVERYGVAEVREWLFELWNEPDIFYWKGTPEQFCDLYRVTAEAVRSVLPDAKVGGPAVTGGGVEFLRTFLTYTSEHDVPLDFVSFHTKGSAFTPWRVYGPTGAPARRSRTPRRTRCCTRSAACSGSSPSSRSTTACPPSSTSATRASPRTTASTTTRTSSSRTPSTTRCSRSSSSRRSSTSTRPRPSRSSRPPRGASTSRASGTSRGPARSSPPAGSRSRCSTPTAWCPASADAGSPRRRTP